MRRPCQPPLARTRLSCVHRVSASPRAPPLAVVPNTTIQPLRPASPSRPPDGAWDAPLRRLASALCRVDTFYDSMGGIVGYQLKSLQLITEAAASSEAAAAAAAAECAAADAMDACEGVAQRPEEHAAGEAQVGTGGVLRGRRRASPATCKGWRPVEPLSPPSAAPACTVPTPPPRSPLAPPAQVRYHVPPALDLAGEAGRRVGVRAAANGIMSLPFMAEILPVGGAARPQPRAPASCLCACSVSGRACLIGLFC